MLSVAGLPASRLLGRSRRRVYFVGPGVRARGVLNPPRAPPGFFFVGVNMADAPYVPTLEQIAEACRSIQSTWSPADERQRRTGTSKQQRPYEVPQVSTPTDSRGERLG